MTEHILFGGQDSLSDRLQRASESGATGVQIKLTNADLDLLATSEIETLASLPDEAKIMVEAIVVEELTRLSEISTHPVSREKTQARLRTALEAAKALGAKRLILAAKEVVPADVAAPAYKVALRSLVEEATASGIRVEIKPEHRWPQSEAELLLEEVQPMMLGLWKFESDFSPSADEING